jgi:hypothetical protein
VIETYGHAQFPQIAIGTGDFDGFVVDGAHGVILTGFLSQTHIGCNFPIGELGFTLIHKSSWN